MKGILIKDLLLLKQMGMQYIFVVGIFIFVSVMNKSAVLFSTMICLLPVFVIINLFTLEGSFPSDMLAMSIPPGRSRTVLSRYLLLLLCVLCFAVIGAVVFMITGLPLQESLLTLGLTSCAAVGVLSIMLPVIIKLGVVKGRIVLLLMGMLPMLVPFLSSQGAPVMEFTASSNLFLLALAAAMVLFVCSAWISVRIYTKKEI